MAEAASAEEFQAAGAASAEAEQADNSYDMKGCGGQVKITDLEPKPVFKFFEDIAAIPHGSGNTEAIAEYCMSFAKERGLRCSKDEGGNVLIFKGGTEGYEDSPSVILQGHLDMVCESSPAARKIWKPMA